MKAPRAALALAALLLVGACSDGAAVTKSAPLNSVSTTVAVTTPVTTPLTTPVTMPAPSTTVAATDPVTAAPTTTEPLPVPEPSPEPRAPEPYTVLGTIEIPKLHVSKTLLEGVTLTTLDKGPGHWPGSAMPGHRGNVVVAGHRTSHDRPFRNIDRLVAGDQVIFTTPDGRFVYTVVSSEVVDPDALRIIDQTDADTATLFACTPPGSTKFRLVVHLQLAPGA